MSVAPTSITRALVGSPTVVSVPSLALTMREAARALGVGMVFMAEHVAGEVRTVRRGDVELIPVAELEAWLTRNSTFRGTE